MAASCASRDEGRGMRDEGHVGACYARPEEQRRPGFPSPTEGEGPGVRGGREMRFSDMVGLARDNLSRARLRTVLTSTGVMIGTAAVVMLLAAGNGAEA